MKIPKLKNKAFQIDLGIYPFAVFVCFGDVEKLRPVLQAYKYKIDEDSIEKLVTHIRKRSENCAGNAFLLENGNVVVWIKQMVYSEDPCYIVNTISHEALHATEMVLNTIGMKLHKKSEEAYCYLHGYIVEKIFEQI